MYEIYQALLKERGLNSSDVSKATGITTGALSHWKNGRNTPKIDTLQKIANFLGVSLNYLTTGKEDSAPKIEPEYWTLIEKYKRLSPANKAAVLSVIDTFLLGQTTEKNEALSS